VKLNLSNWGNYPVVDTEVRTLNTTHSNIPGNGQMIARGLGRCYGDSALANVVLSTLSLNKMLSFDENTGILTCESGVSFDEILKVFVPRGFFLPVTPGTKFITVGGAIASDIHGKNHHSEGTFSAHVISLKMLLADGSVHLCSPSVHSELFFATCGGMGLTGIILEASFRLKKIDSAMISQKAIRCSGLDEILEQFDITEHWTYSVAWIDCLSTGKSLGRSILMLGEHSKAENSTPEKRYVTHTQGKLSVPFQFPSFALNTLSVRAFNFLYYHKQFRRSIENSIHYDPYFYPLDSILHWNRIYGRRGFTQYQFVIPKEGGKEGLRQIISEIAKSGQGSFLAVLKLFGQQHMHNPLLFPAGGYTLALDFPITKALFPLLNRLDEMVAERGGRVYLTKDARLSKENFLRFYPAAPEFREYLRKIDPNQKFASMQSIRLGLHDAV
jgi:FAD/FMN-containing dehydrogenase